MIDEANQSSHADTGPVKRIVVLQPAGLDVQAVHPKNGAKYSPNLHKWLTAKSAGHRARTSRVYSSTNRGLLIGRLDDGYLIGTRLNDVLCNGAKAGSWAIGARGLVEVADFWPRYLAEGRCAIDPEHAVCFVGDDTRWTQEGDTRACLWCGKARQVLARWTEAVERQEWRNLQHNVGGEGAPCGTGLTNTTTATPQGVASTDQLGGRVRSEKD